MIYLKTCPRCHGDMIAVSDHYGRYTQCLQCGFETEPRKVAQQSSVASGATSRRTSRRA